MKTSALSGLRARLYFLFMLLMLAGAAACDRLEPDIHIRRSLTFPSHDKSRVHRGGADVDSTGAPVVIPPDGLFVTAVAYPDGYDWRRDTARGDIRGRLLLLRMQDETAAFDTVLALEAGAGRPVSLDPDRHQFIGGHLYTQCITEAGTIYRRDGRTVFLSREREYLRGILAQDDDALFTLSQRLDGAGGFVLRRNWKPLLAREGGRIHGSLGEPGWSRTGALFADGGDVCFFYDNTGSDGGWILVRCKAGSEGQSSEAATREVREEPVTLPDGITHLHDLRCYDGVLCVACRWKQREPVLFVGNKKYDLSATFPTPAAKSGFRLLCSDAGIRISGAVRLRYNGRLYTCLWSEKRLLATKEGHCDWWDPEFFVRKENGRVVETGIDGCSYPLEGGTLMMPACAFRTGSDLYLAMAGDSTGDDNPVPGNPVLWHNGESIPLIFNGFPTSVTVR